ISYTTVPSNGDLNPYGLAVVPAGFPGGGVLHAGDYLVSNFNDKANTQGTGTTIVYVTPGQTPPATAPVFFTSQATGLSEALGDLRSGFVIVCNVLSGTVERINFKAVKHRGQVSLEVTSMTQIASGYTVQPNAAAVVVGP